MIPPAMGRVNSRSMAGSPQRLSAGVVVVRRIDGRWRFLLLRAYNNWDFPKGMLEPGEAARAAAVREVAEETTIADLHFRWGDDYIETPPYNRNKVARYYLAESPGAPVSLPVSPELGRPEHHEFRWAGPAEALRRVSPRLEPVLRWALEKLADSRAS